MFLFHTGSIKRHDCAKHLPSVGQFLFHTGSIKSVWCKPAFTLTTRFYSILVRLKVKAIEVLERAEGAFLFHTGSIKSSSMKPLMKNGVSFYSILVRLKGCLFLVPNPLARKRFYSILVRLKAIGWVHKTRTAIAVSIPYWFD